MHAHAYNALLYGARHWLMRPPGFGAPAFRWSTYHRCSQHGGGGGCVACLSVRCGCSNQHDSTHAWLLAREVAGGTTAQRDTFQCDQRAGDVIYVPTNWMHAVRNEQVCRRCASRRRPAHTGRRWQTLRPLVRRKASGWRSGWGHAAASSSCTCSRGRLGPARRAPADATCDRSVTRPVTGVLYGGRGRMQKALRGW
jgi:hypothetical protein